MNHSARKRYGRQIVSWILILSLLFTSCEWPAVAHAAGIQETETWDEESATASIGSDSAGETAGNLERTEIPEERTAGSTSWQLSDGRKEVVYHLGTVRFEDENGEWVDYDPSLVEIGEEEIQENEELSGYSHKNTAGGRKQYFPQNLNGDTPLRMENGTYLLEAAPLQEGTQEEFFVWKALEEITTEDSEIVDLYGQLMEKTVTAGYEAQDGSFALKYIPDIKGVTENLVLYEQPSSNIWRYALQFGNEGIQAGKEETCEGIRFFRLDEEEKKEILGGIQVPVMNDASGENYSEGVSYDLEEDSETPGRYILTVIADEEYLAAPDTQYPVTIRSSCVWASASDSGEVSVISGRTEENAVENAEGSAAENAEEITEENAEKSTEESVSEDNSETVAEKTPANTNFYNPGLISFCVGNSGQGTSRAYLNPFAGMQLTDSQMEQVFLNLVETENCQPDGTLEVYQAVGDWNPALITWNNQPGISDECFGTAVTTGEAGHVVSIDLTGYIRAQEESGTDYGLVLKSAEETDGGTFMQFYNSRYAGAASYTPSISVIYEGPAAENTDPEESLEAAGNDQAVSPDEGKGDGIENTENTDPEDTELSEDDEEVHADVIGEIKELRDECSKQFLLDDGTVSMVQYDTDVHYQDGEGNWQEIDNTLSDSSAEDSSDASGYSTKEGRVNFKFAKNVNANFLVRIMQGSRHVFFSLENAQKKSDGAKILPFGQEERGDGSSLADQVEVDNIRSGVIYEDILPGTDLEYMTSGSSLKENIIVKEKQDSYQYTFEVKVNQLDVVQEEDGSISFRDQDTGERFYTIPAMYMTDANGAESDAVDFQITTKNKKSTLTITADAAWINADDRAFPIVIDPTLEATSSSTGDESRIVRNQYVASGHPTVSSAGYGRGYLGYDGSGDKIYRLFVQFKTLPVIPDTSVIASAKFYYAQAAYDHVGMSELVIAAKEVTEDWTWGTKVNWNTQPAFSSTVLDFQVLSSSTTGKYVGWDITKLIKSHYENKDNTTNATSSFVLTGTDEVNYAYNHLAKADVIQENSSGYFSSAQPVLVIVYRDTRGLENYYTYQTQSVGKAGTAYIGDYTRELTLEHVDFATSSTAIPFQLSHVYNSAFGDEYFTSTAGFLTKNFSNMKIGMGWKLNIQETIIEKTISGTKYLVYNDADGTDHYMPLDSGSTYKDEDGLKLTVTKATSPIKYTMTDEKGNRKIFHNGFLSSILDANGNAIHLLYNGAEYSSGGAWYANTGTTNRVTKIVQINKGQTTPVTIATLDYAGTAFLHSVTDYAGRTWQFKFTAGTNAAGEARGYNLTRIVEPDSTYARYDYYLLSTHKVNKLARTYDSETLLGGRFTYTVTKHSSRMSSFGQINWTSGSEYQTGQTVAITNTEPLQTYFRDRGLDCTAGTDDDIDTYVLFDNAGRTISEASTDRTGNVFYGASSTSYTGTGSATDSNRILNGVVTGVNGVNLLQNGSAETVSGSTATGWSTQKKTSSATAGQMTLAYDTAGPIRTGSRSFHITTGTDTQPDSSGNLMAVFSTTAALTAGKTYTFSGYFKNTGADHFNDKSQAYLRISNSSGTQMAISSIVKECTSDSIEEGWTRLSATFTPSSAGTYTFAACTNWIYGDSGFDDFQLEEGECASSLFSQVFFPYFSRNF